MFIDFSFEKNKWLLKTRGVCFDHVIEAIKQGFLLKIQEHPNESRYGHQKVMMVAIENYVYIVPFVQNGETLFLKTVFPSRKFTKMLIGKEFNEK